MKLLFLLSALAFLMSASSAHASQVLNCTLSTPGQGSAQIEVLRVENHPELALLKVDLRVVPVKAGAASGAGLVHLQGLLGAISSNGQILATGDVFNTGDGPIINPESISLQGSALPDGSLQLELLDEDEVLQLGYGAHLLCK